MHEVLNLGAGVQSTAVLLMSCHGDLPPLDCAVFADTQWEPAAVYRHLDWLESVSTVPIHRVTAGNLRERTWKAVNRTDCNGTPRERFASLPLRTSPDGGLIRRQCTRDYKILPIEQFIRRKVMGLRPRQHAKKGSVRQWLGISFDEAHRMAKNRNKWAELYYPLVQKRITRTGCYDWLAKHGYPEPPRSACIVCPFRSKDEWRMLTDEEFEEACAFDEACRHQVGMHGECYLHRSLKPLREVDLRTDNEKAGQLSLWQDECCGVCGV